MEKLKHQVTQLEIQIENLEERVINHDYRVTAMEPAVKHASNNNVVVYVSLAITVINLLLLLLR